MNKLIPTTCLNINDRVKFNLKLGIYQNIIVFFEDHDLLFLSKMNIDFTKVPLILHGNGNSSNLNEYLKNNNSNSTLIVKFLYYFLFNIIDIKYEYDDTIFFYFVKNTQWQKINLQIYLPSKVVTTTTTYPPVCISAVVGFGCNQPDSDNLVYAGVSLFGLADVTYTISIIPNIEFNDYSLEGADPIIVTIPIHTSGGSGSRIANRNNSVESCLSGGTLMPLRICTVSSISISPSGYFYSNAIICTTTTTAPTTTTTTT